MSRLPPEVTYVSEHAPWLASYRYRIALPAPHMGLTWALGYGGSIAFFYKHQDGDEDIARVARNGGAQIVYDVVNPHFDGELGGHYLRMIALADLVTCSSEWMRRKISAETDRQARVVPDPYENDEREPTCEGRNVLWFGHAANLPSIARGNDIKAARANLVVCSNGGQPFAYNVPWSPESEAQCLQTCSLVWLSGHNPGASGNRVIKALRAGKPVVADDVEAWREFNDFIWIGDTEEGIEWTLSHRKEAMAKTRAGQEYVRQRFSPPTVGAQWGAIFRTLLSGSTSAVATSAPRDISTSISPTTPDHVSSEGVSPMS